eukprot:m.215912 g.215912  ORF g.215912 m.215912 type:complete len:949 (-) comp15544_c0_seq9:2511-5357(-)
MENSRADQDGREVHQSLVAHPHSVPLLVESDDEHQLEHIYSLEIVQKLRDIIDQGIDAQCKCFLAALVCSEFDEKIHEVVLLAEEFKSCGQGEDNDAAKSCCELELHQAHVFLKQRGHATDTHELQQVFDKIDIERNSKMSFLEYCLFSYGISLAQLFQVRSTHSASYLRALDDAIGRVQKFGTEPPFASSKTEGLQPDSTTEIRGPWQAQPSTCGQKNHAEVASAWSSTSIASTQRTNSTSKSKSKRSRKVAPLVTEQTENEPTRITYTVDDAVDSGNIRGGRPSMSAINPNDLSPQDRNAFVSTGQRLRKSMNTMALKHHIGISETVWSELKQMFRARANEVTAHSKGIERPGERVLLADIAVELWGPLGFLMVHPQNDHADPTRFYFEFRKDLLYKLIPGDTTDPDATDRRREAAKAAIQTRLSKMLKVKNVIHCGFNLRFVNWRLSNTHSERCRWLQVQSTNYQRMVPVMSTCREGKVTRITAHSDISNLVESLGTALESIAADFDTAGNPSALKGEAATPSVEKIVNQAAESTRENENNDGDSASVESEAAYIEHSAQCTVPPAVMDGEETPKFTCNPDCLCKDLSERMSKAEASLCGTQRRLLRTEKELRKAQKQTQTWLWLCFILVLVLFGCNLGFAIYLGREAYHHHEHGFAKLDGKLAAEEYYRASNDTAEAMIRLQRDRELSDHINTESRERRGNDQLIRTRANTDRSHRIGNHSLLEGNLDDERRYRIGNDTIHQLSLANETANRILGDSVNSAQLTAERSVRISEIAILTARPFPVAGTVMHFTRQCPAGYVPANGSTLSRARYPDLFRACFPCGPGDGNTTFTLPDWSTESKFIRAAGPLIGIGVQQDQATAAGNLHVDVNVDPHAHGVSLNVGASGWQSFYSHAPHSAYQFQYPLNSPHTVQTTGSTVRARATVSSSDTETRPTSVALTMCIKV